METDKTTSVPVVPRRDKLSEAQRILLERRLRGNGTSNGNNQIGRRAPGTPVPLSAEQRRIWLHASHQPSLAIYNEPITIHKRGTFSLAVLEASVTEILRRHEAWRTTFTPEGEAVVHDTAHVTLPFTDLSHLPETAREAEALKIASATAREPIPLDCFPLFRSHVVRISAQEHRWYLTVNHIIFDGISISRVLVPELSAIYAAFEQGRPSPLAEPALQYGDYAVWRAQQLESSAEKQHMRYWLRQLGGELPILELPIDRPRPAMTSHRGSMECFRLPASLREDLYRICRTRGVTLYVLLLAAFKVLLFRYSGQDDIIVGSATDARRRPELAGVMGYFLDTIALRTRPHADLSFSDYLGRTRDVVLEAFDAADVPFDRIVYELRPPRDSSHHPIFQAFFTMRPSLLELPAGWDLTHMDVTVGSSKFDIYLELGERPDHIEGRILYSTDLFDAATIRRMQTHWLVLLESLCHNPEGALGEFAILAPEEHSSLLGLSTWNNTASSFPQVPLQGLIEEQASRTPNAIAAVFENKPCTYRELNARSEIIAQALTEVGVTRGSIVAIALERSVELLASLIAVMKLRAAYLPLDIYMPRERIALCLADAQPSAILTEEFVQSRVSPTAFPTLLLEDIPDRRTSEGMAYRSDFAQFAEALDDTAYVIYTSGSTGAPKAVEVPQRSLVNLLASMERSPGFTSRDTMLALTAISFDIAALELFLPLICGGRVVIASREESQDPHQLSKAIKRSGCTVIQGTPATWRTLLLSGWNEARQRSALGASCTLKILCGGEALTVELADHLLATGAELWNMYGPTETTIWSMIHRVLPTKSERLGSVSIGHPIANTQAYILDAQRQLLPFGVPGELYLGGTGLAKGYRGQPLQTSERFCLVATVGGARLYRTGDMAVRRSIETVEIRGRTDHQVKIRGYRVELEAVEAAALQYSQISSAAARIWPEITGENRLSLYIVGNGTTSPNPSELKAFLAKSLPTYMLPSDIISLPEMPLTSNGKTDRSRLPEPLTSNISQLYTAEFSTYEAAIATMWAELLGLRSINLDDNFFDLGGHSVLIAALQQRLAVELKQRIPMAQLFHSPTVRKQAALLQQIIENKPSSPPGVLALQPNGRGEAVFWVHYANEGLATALGTSQPFLSVVLTIEDMISMGESPTLEKIAACHVEKILETQSKGPFNLGGFCAGGVLAYEVASLLRTAGHDVSLLVIVDAPNPSPPKLKKLLHYVHWIAVKGGMTALSRTVRKHLEGRFRRFAGRVSNENEMRTAQDMIEAAAARYKPRKYDGRVLLVQASDRIHLDFLYGWREVVRDSLNNEYVAGHHDELMKANRVNEVGQVILSHIQPAR